jgi:hypothetical protein
MEMATTTPRGSAKNMAKEAVVVKAVEAVEAAAIEAKALEAKEVEAKAAAAKAAEKEAMEKEVRGARSATAPYAPETASPRVWSNHTTRRLALEKAAVWRESQCMQHAENSSSWIGSGIWLKREPLPTKCNSRKKSTRSQRMFLRRR